METLNIIIPLILAVLLGIYNGQFITKRSKAWHRTGWIIRLLIGVMLYPDVTLMLIYSFLAWIVYDLIINWYMKKPWNYVGDSSEFDKLPGCVLAMSKLLVTFGMIAAILINWFGL